ncbi:MAG: hypothetical protein J0L72_11840 [Armatimonadetes bacterium]|nr:hypothetical protein [Armatimonadota bacterium]
MRTRGVPVRFFVLPILGGLALLSGCGGSAAWGRNQLATVEINSAAIEDLDLIVVPNEGGPDATVACSESYIGFDCGRLIGPDFTQIRFTTSSQASQHPYRVYVRNNGSRTRRVWLDVYFDNKPNYSYGFDVYAGETRWAAVVRRNNAGIR